MWIAVKEIKKAKEERRPHRWILWKMVPWPYCCHCGLMYLKNDATARSAKQGCLQEITGQ